MIANTDEADELDVLADVARWSGRSLEGDAPHFGTLEWASLDDNDPRRDKAAVRYALAHWRMGAPVEELEARVEAAELKLSSLGISAAEDWTGLSYRPSAAELARRRDWNVRAAREARPTAIHSQAGADVTAYSERAA